MALSLNNGRTSRSGLPAYLAEPLLQDWLLSEDDREPFNLGLLHEDSAIVIDVFDLDLDLCELFLAAKTGAQASRIEPKNAGGYETHDVDSSELLLAAESTALASCDKTTEADDSSEDTDYDVGKPLGATEVVGLPSDAEDDTKDADFDDIVTPELARAADWFRDTPNQSDKREMARLGTVAHYQTAYNEQQARFTAGVTLRAGEVQLGKLSFSNVSAHIKKLLGEIPGHVVPIPLCPESLEVLEAITALCAFILRHNPVLPKELAVVVLVYDVKTRLFQAAALAARRRMQEDIEAGLVIPVQRRSGGLGLRKLWRRLFRAEGSAAGVYTAINTADAVAEPSPVSATPPVASRVRKFRLPWMKP
ncbi:hypothetical protein HK405_004517, partial [Cladochytrium tenue]